MRPALVLALIAASGCAAVTTMQTARSLPAGKTQVAVGPELNGGGIREGKQVSAHPFFYTGGHLKLPTDDQPSASNRSVRRFSTVQSRRH